MADVEQGSYSYSKERESLHDQCTDMTSVHPGQDPTYIGTHTATPNALQLPY